MDCGVVVSRFRRLPVDVRYRSLTLSIELTSTSFPVVVKASRASFDSRFALLLCICAVKIIYSGANNAHKIHAPRRTPTNVSLRLIAGRFRCTELKTQSSNVIAHVVMIVKVPRKLGSGCHLMVWFELPVIGSIMIV